MTTTLVVAEQGCSLEEANKVTLTVTPGPSSPAHSPSPSLNPYPYPYPYPYPTPTPTLTPTPHPLTRRVPVASRALAAELPRDTLLLRRRG